MNSEWKKYSLHHAILTISLLIAAGIVEICPSRRSEFLEGDLTISHTCGNTVSEVMVLLYYFINVILLIAIVFIFASKSTRCKMILHSILFSARVLSSTLLLVNVLKVFTGRPRPCFFDRCGYPRTGNIYGDIGRFGTISKCTNSYREINDALRSFPSGHAMISSASFTLCFCILKYVFRNSNQWNQHLIRMLRNLFLIFSFVISLLISATRIFDYRHFASDVVCGYILGVVVTLYSEQSLFFEESISTEDNEVSDKEELVRILDA